MVLRAPAAPFTWEDLQAMADDGYRRELVHGQLLVTPSPLPRHQRVAMRLAVTLATHCPEHLEVYPAPLDWRASDNTVLEPDILVLRSEDYTPDAWPTATPLLVVEIASPSTATTDRTLKRAAYEEAGVPSYWVIDPVEPSLTVLELDGDTYREIATVGGDEPFGAERPFPVTVVPGALTR